MGQDGSKDTQDTEEIGEFLDDHPQFLSTYIDRNPDLLDHYVYDNVDEATVKKWLEKVAEPAPSEVLQLLNIDYLKVKNGFLNNTSQYVHRKLVVRRAEKFSLDLTFKNRAFRKAKDSLILEFSIGSDPKQVTGTKMRVPIGDSLQGSQWTAMLVKEDEAEKKISVQINIPPTAIIGKYHVTFEATTALEPGPQVVRKDQSDIIVIFNPFQPADDVYMENAKERDEYVLNDQGIIYRGSSNRIRGKEWDFGQFDEGILDIALKLMREDSRSKNLKKRNSPMHCSRVLSAMVNSNDDNGVLYGRWDGEYEDGKGPGFWKGSVDILKKWNAEGMKEVKYGQCWVFSGLLTTVLRAIGIPARSTTNFASAHDTEFNMTIDTFVNEDGESVERGGDSVWNFHVWNDCYFRRPDLPKGYDGWQAVDATPQELSGDIFQCGPAPLKAIKNGEVFIGHDTNFVFSEVNADRCVWRVNKDGDVTELARRLYRSVGKNISTKAVGSNERHDITNEYKFPEGSDEERAAFQLAYAFGKKADYHDDFAVKGEGDITIEITEVGDTIFGNPTKIKVSVTNTTDKACSTAINTLVCTMLHTGESKYILRKIKKRVDLKAKQTESLLIDIAYIDYAGKLVDDNVIRTTTSVRNIDDDIMYVDSNDLTVDFPDDMLFIECGDEYPGREDFELRFKLENKFDFSFTGGVFTITGPRLIEKSIVVDGIIEPGTTYISEPVKTCCYGRSKRFLTADFDCKEFKNLEGRKEVDFY